MLRTAPRTVLCPQNQHFRVRPIKHSPLGRDSSAFPAFPSSTIQELGFELGGEDLDNSMQALHSKVIFDRQTRGSFLKRRGAFSFILICPVFLHLCYSDNWPFWDLFYLVWGNSSYGWEEPFTSQGKTHQLHFKCLWGTLGEGVDGDGLDTPFLSQGLTPLSCFALGELPSWGAWREWWQLWAQGWVQHYHDGPGKCK